MTRRFRNKRDKSRTSRATLPCWALLEPVPAHCKTSTPAQHLLGYSMHSTPPVGLCPRCSLCPCLLQVSSSREILWTLSSFPPSLRREAASPGPTEVRIPSAADKLQLPFSASCRFVPILPSAHHLLRPKCSAPTLYLLSFLHSATQLVWLAMSWHPENTNKASV